MNDISISLLLSGVLAGFVNYLVFFKKLPMPTPNYPTSEMAAEGQPGFLDKIWLFIKAHWHIFGYLIIGIAGAFLFPMMFEVLKLAGLPATIKDCNTEECLTSWQEKVVFGYGLIFGVFTVRLLYGVFGGIFKKVESLTYQVQELERARPAVFMAPSARIGVTEAQEPLLEPLVQVVGFDDLKNVPDWRFFVKGVDVSHHNLNLDWGAIREKGVEFAYIKITDGVGTLDRKAQENAHQARHNGLKIGYYHFARPDKKIGGTIEADANAEANEIKGVLRNLPAADLPLMLDLEDESGRWDTPLNPSQYHLWITTFMNHFTIPPNKSPIIYSRKEYLDRKLPAGHSLGSYPLWISRYNEDFNKAFPALGWSEWAVWQFTEKGALGTNIPLDLNICKRNHYQNLLV